MNKKRLQEIEETWMNNGNGLAIRGNSSYRMIAELLMEIKILANEIGVVASPQPFPEIPKDLYSDLCIGIFRDRR